METQSQKDPHKVDPWGSNQSGPNRIVTWLRLGFCNSNGESHLTSDLKALKLQLCCELQSENKLKSKNGDSEIDFELSIAVILVILFL